MGTMTLPPGFRFHPTDDELVGYYLKRKVDGLKFELEVIPVIDLYKFEPWELPDKSFLPKRDMEWFFFCPRDRKYPNGSRTNRATATGYWKATGKDRKIACEPSVNGLRKTLVFYRGRAPGGERTDWVMHEYRLCEDLSHGCSNFIGAFALCRVVKRNENGQKAGDLQGDPKAKGCRSAAAMDCSPKGYLSKVSSSSCLTTDHLGRSNAATPTNSPLEISTEMDQIALQPELNDSAQFAVPHAFKSSLPYRESYDMMTMDGISSSLHSSLQLPYLSSINTPEDTFLMNELHAAQSETSYASPIDCLGMCSNAENLSSNMFEWDAPRYPNTFSNGADAWNPSVSPMLCRQASEGEDANLWFQEDNMIVVMTT